MTPPHSPRPLPVEASVPRQGGPAEGAIRSPVVQARARAGYVPGERPAGIRRSARSVGCGVRRDAPLAGGPHGALEGGASFRSKGCSGRPRRTATANAATGAAGLSPGTRYGARPRSRRGESPNAAGRKTRNAGTEPPHGLVLGSTTCWGRLRQVNTPPHGVPGRHGRHESLDRNRPQHPRQGSRKGARAERPRGHLRHPRRGTRRPRVRTFKRSGPSGRYSRPGSRSSWAPA